MTRSSGVGGNPPDGHNSTTGGGIGTRLAGSLVRVDALPTALRAVLDYYASTGTFALDVVRLQRRVDAFVDGVIEDAFHDVERAISAELDIDPETVTFDYGTKLTMPAELTLGHIYQRDHAESGGGGSTDRSSSGNADRNENADRDGNADDDSPVTAPIERAESVTELVVVALLDGDMRDAINDAEYEDFAVDGVEIGTTITRSRVAEIAQAVLQKRVETLFDRFDETVRTAYQEAVALSEQHQDRDPHFRDLMADAETGDEAALEAIRTEYKFDQFDDADSGAAALIKPATMFSEAELAFPYLKTQYGRVGVIYDGMIEMYRAAGIDIEDTFKRSIVCTIIGAQIWLDDIDDYEADLAETQLTPVTAEYLLAESDAEAYAQVVKATNQYLDAAERYAAETDSPLAGIGANYVLYSGDPSVLPGAN